ncbi:hypothetical protein BN12_70011 [Nostocoides japonicum T1-X7]|uniref:Uncharacterized protein n=1 Tax=Nostocoides japonicum T1-X7 TaxID=1194083 RepID=A0A077M7G4_9MICO|nr:hypothetical protein BN12_70011 [Tetrasphaera japonica T1-X7]
MTWSFPRTPLSTAGARLRRMTNLRLGETESEALPAKAEEEGRSIERSTCFVLADGLANEAQRTI